MSKYEALRKQCGNKVMTELAREGVVMPGYITSTYTIVFWEWKWGTRVG